MTLAMLPATYFEKRMRHPMRRGWIGMMCSLLMASVEASDWTQMAAIPDKEGFASPFAGTHGDKLIVAGGANFPGAKPWEGGAKVWYDQVWVLEAPEATWQQVGRLPRPLAYGVSISTPEGLICIGGSDATSHYAEVFRLKLDENAVSIEALPNLPQTCANMCGALVGRTLFVAGGTETPTATQALHTLWTLDLDEVAAGWQVLEPWPGKERLLATAGALDGAFYLVGGVALKVGEEGKVERVWLQDGYRFTQADGWQRMADAPQISVAAPGPMPAMGGGDLWLIGGDDGSQVTVSPDDHKGFPRDVWAYQTTRNEWRRVGEIPLGLVTTSAVVWQGRVVVTGGEKRPGIRSTEVWSLPIP